jgi:hypothetical protein
MIALQKDDCQLPCPDPMLAALLCPVRMLLIRSACCFASESFFLGTKLTISLQML